MGTYQNLKVKEASKPGCIDRVASEMGTDSSGLAGMALLLSALVMPSLVSSGKRDPRWEVNVAKPVQAHDRVFVMSEPQRIKLGDFPVPRSGGAMLVNERVVWDFTDESGRMVRVPQSQVPRLAVGDLLVVDHMANKHFMIPGVSICEADKVTIIK
jgi:hypothetical protein